MNSLSPENEPSIERRLDELVARYLQAEESGKPVDVEALLRPDPELREQFGAFLAQHNRMRQSETPTATFSMATGTKPNEPTGAPVVQAGDVVGDCRIARRLGEGGMGVVYLGEHVRVKDLRAIKVLPRERVTDQAIRRFWREAQSAARISHLNVVTIHDVGQLDNLHYIVMQYVDGKTIVEVLDRHLLRNPGKVFPWTSALQIIIPVLDALAAMHRQGLLHRDIKPSNIMVTGAVSRRQHVVLMDFGLVQDEDDATLTDGGVVVGTPAYMSREQARAKPLDVRSDLYSVGATLYFLLTGRPPFQGKRTDVYLRVASGETPEPIEQLRSDMPPEVCAAIAKAMSPDRGKRFRRAEEMIDEFTSLLRKYGKGAGKGASAGGKDSPPPVPKRDSNQVVERPVAVPPPQAHDTVVSNSDTFGDPLPDVAPLQAVASRSDSASSGSLPVLLYADDDESQWMAQLSGLARSPKLQAAAGATMALVLLIGLGIFALNQGGGPPSPKPTSPPTPNAAPPAPSRYEGMVYIPAGGVRLGCDQARSRTHALTLDSIKENPDMVNSFVDLCDNGAPQMVQLKGFWIDQYEVTNARYAKFITATGHAPPATWSGNVPPAGKEDHPVTHVSWNDAQAYAAWAGKRLPTEAQWVRAYRGDTDQMYPWGDVWESKRANTWQNNDFGQGISPVAVSPTDRTPLDVRNMVGNACEMTRDQTQKNATTMAIVKGSDGDANGDWYASAPVQRYIALNDVQQGFVSFRCVLEEER